MEDRTRLSRRSADGPPPPPPVPPAGNDGPGHRTQIPHSHPPAPESEASKLFHPASGLSRNPESLETDPTTGWLVVIAGPGEGSAMTLGYGSHSVGRDETQRLRLDFGDLEIVGRNHAVITYDGSGRRFHVSHGGGGAVALLNGQPVLQPHVLAGGDRLRIGRTELMFEPFCGADFDWREG